MKVPKVRKLLATPATPVAPKKPRRAEVSDTELEVEKSNTIEPKAFTVKAIDGSVATFKPFSFANFTEEERREMIRYLAEEKEEMRHQEYLDRRE